MNLDTYDRYKLQGDRDNNRNVTSSMYFEVVFPKRLRTFVEEKLQGLLFNLELEYSDEGEEETLGIFVVMGDFAFEAGEFFDESYTWDVFKDQCFWDFGDYYPELDFTDKQ